MSGLCIQFKVPVLLKQGSDPDRARFIICHPCWRMTGIATEHLSSTTLHASPQCCLH
jgi:hypothetical protein